MTFKQLRSLTFHGAAFFLLYQATPAYSADYFLQGHMPYGTNWTNPSSWFSNPSGGGTNPLGYPSGFLGNNFVTNGYYLRLNATTFAGGSLEVGPSWPDIKDLLILKYTSGAATIPVLYSEGGAEINQGEGVISRLNVNYFENYISTQINTAGTGKGVDLVVGTISGAGDLYLIGGGYVKFGATDATAFTGDINWGSTQTTQLEFTSDFTSGGKLVVPSNGRLYLHQNVTFRSVTINGTALSPGTYSFATLNTSFGTQMVDGGSGSITVQALPAPDLDLTGYTLSFADEFDGPLSVSNWGWGTKWIAHKPDGGDFGHGVFTYAPPNYVPHSVSNGILSLKAWYSTIDSRWHAANLSSIAQKGYGFAQRYGYFEARMKFSNKSYGWPSFWLLSTGAFEVPVVRTAELDAVEFYGTSPTTAFTTTHRWNMGTNHQTGLTTTVAGMTSSFHTYGVLVEPETITYFIDGMKIYQQPNFPEAQTPLFPLVTYALKSTPPASEQGVVSATEVDYVRVYAAPPSVTGIIPCTDYAIHSVDSQDSANLPAKAIDGDYMTHWLSAPGVAKPHEIKIDLGSPRAVNGLTYLPRQSTGTLDGLIQNYEVRVSTNGTTWTLVDSGTWSNSPLEKSSSFTEQTGIRYVSLKDVGSNGTLTAAAEINISGESSTPPVTNLAPSGVISAYSSYSSGYGPSKAIDGIDTDSANWWRGSSALYPQWIEIDLGANKQISATELVGYDNRAYRYRVEAKPSGGTYQTVVDRTSNTQASPVSDNFQTVTARYVKLTVTGAYNYTGNWTTLQEFKVFGY